MIHNNLFISNFKKFMKKFLPVVAVAAVFFLGCHVLNYLYVEMVDTNEWTRILWHNFYEEEENIDNLYLGSSHVYCSLNPDELDEMTGENNFNLSSPAQRLNGSYYLIREADRKHDLKHVYVDVYYNVATGVEGEFKKDGVGANWFNADYMENSPNRFAYIFHMSDKSGYMESIMPFIRYRSRLFDKEYIKANVDKKSGIDFSNYQYVKQNEKGFVQFMDKGFYYTTLELQEKDLFFNQTKYMGEENPLTEDAKVYLQKIIEYCKENDIELTLFSAPVYRLEILGTGDYDTYINYVRNIADEYDVEYYDFNLIKEEYFPASDRTYFSDREHLNTAGSEIFSEVFYQVMQKGKEESKEYFYQSYGDMLRETDGDIFGILDVSAIEGTKEGQRRFKVASNKSEGIEYQISLKPKGNEKVMVQDFSANPYFDVVNGEKGTCVIVARRAGETEPFRTIKVKY